MAAVDFFETQSTLSQYVGNKVKGVAGASAISTLEHPNLKEPSVPICVTKTVTMEVDGNDVGTESNVPVISDQLYGFMYKKYMVQYKAWFTKTETWTKKNADIFNLVLQPCPKVLESLLHNHGDL